MLKPFIKWLGGKTQLIDKIAPMIPEDTEVYIELFLGGGAVLLNQLENNDNIKLFIVNDLNTNLIDTYNCIKYNNSYFLLVERLKRLEEQYNSIDKKKEFYYEKRKEYNYLVSHPQLNNKMDGNRECSYSTDYLVRKSSLFMFINKTCFNGLYRVNKKGELNAAFNNAKYFHPDFSNLENLHKLFLNKDVHFINKSYEDTLEYIEFKVNQSGLKNCFVYLDPPYKEISKNNGVVQYTSEGFDDRQQEKLKEFCDTLTDKGFKILESNSDPVDCNFFDNLYTKYTIKRVKAARRINSDGKGRGPIDELLIKNY